MINMKTLQSIVIVLGLCVSFTGCEKIKDRSTEKSEIEFRIERVETEKGIIFLHFDRVGNVTAVTVMRDGTIERKHINP